MLKFHLYLKELQKEKLENEKLREELKSYKELPHVSLKHMKIIENENTNSNIPKTDPITEKIEENTIKKSQIAPKEYEKRIGNISQINPLDTLSEMNENEQNLNENLSENDSPIDFNISKSGIRYSQVLEVQPDAIKAPEIKIEKPKSPPQIPIPSQRMPILNTSPKTSETIQEKLPSPLIKPNMMENRPQTGNEDFEFVTEIIQEPSEKEENKNIDDEILQSDDENSEIKTPEKSISNPIEILVPDKPKDMQKFTKDSKIKQLTNSIVAGNKLMSAIKKLQNDDIEKSKNLKEKHALKISPPPLSKDTPFIVMPPPNVVQNSPKQKSGIVIPDPPVRKRIFEEFFILGVTKETVNSTILTDISYMPPQIIFQYPNLPINSNWYFIIKDKIAKNVNLLKILHSQKG